MKETAPETPELPDALRRELERQSRYRPLTARRRWLIGLLSIATAFVIFWLLLYRPGGLHGPRWRPGLALCAPGQTTDCVGGQMNLIVAAPASAGSAAR